MVDDLVSKEPLVLQMNNQTIGKKHKFFGKNILNVSIVLLCVSTLQRHRNFQCLPSYYMKICAERMNRLYRDFQ